MDGLVWSETLLDDARAVLHRVEGELSRAGIAGELAVTGPASMPGVLTKGDLDLHLRVAPERFAAVVVGLRALYPPASLHSWASTLAVFDVPASDAGLAVTPTDSVHDRRFSSTWQRLRDHPDLLEEYHELKIRFFGTAEYEARKSDFFDRISALS